MRKATPAPLKRCGRGGLGRQLARAVKDSYVRKSGKQARNWARKKKPKHGRLVHARALAVRMDLYRRASRQMFDILEQFSPLVEPLSIDEAFLDLPGSERSMGTAEAVAHRLRLRIKWDRWTFSPTLLTSGSGNWTRWPTRST